MQECHDVTTEASGIPASGIPASDTPASDTPASNSLGSGTPGGLILVSFDIDGTLEAGDPPGPITFALVAAAKARGYVIGSASDRTLSEQRAIWRQAAIRPDFTCHKHRLRESTSRFNCQRLLHIGDTDLDEYYARLAGFDFRYATDLRADWPTW